MREHRREESGRHRSYWVLKGATRDFYVCTTSGLGEPRAALCIFDSETRAGDYLRSLGAARTFLETMRRYGMQVPRWMLHDPQLPVTRETTVPGIRRVVEGIGVECVAFNPPPVELPARRSGVPELLTLERLEELSRCGDAVTTSEPRQRRPYHYDRAS